MINNCSKAQALLNAQAVMALAVTFGHGDVVTLSVNASAVVLSILYDEEWSVRVREKEWLLNRVMCGVRLDTCNDMEIDLYTIRLIWEFNPNLK